MKYDNKDKSKESILDREFLFSIIRYKEDTGYFYLKVMRGGQRAGTRVGHKNFYGYTVVPINKRPYMAHRLAWFYVHGVWPPEDVDHINNVRNDNRLINLRLALRTENNGNVPKRKHNTSGYKGVTFCKTTQRWRAQLTIHGKPINIGLFDTPEEAHEAYQKAAIEHFGEFANFG